MIRKNTNGTFTVDITQGRDKRHQKRFKTKQEAQRYERLIYEQIDSDKEWQPDNQQDERKLSDLIKLWHKIHGTTLRDGDRVRNRALLVAERLNDPIANTLTNSQWVRYRSHRLKTCKANTINKEQGFINAIYNKLFELDEITYPTPINKVKKIKIVERKLRFLSKDEITTLLETLTGDTLQAAKLCISTGARWGEVKRLQGDQIINNKLHLTQTKSGKNRSIPLKPELAQEITPPLMASEKLFKQGLKEAGIELEQGQNTHVLRHTFASHFIINGGNILTLQKILGHSDIQMTMTYAHLSDDHLNETLTYSPL